MLRAIQITDELERFLEVVKAIGAKTSLEIGTYECGTSMVLALQMGDGSLSVGVDLPESDGGTKAEHEAEAKRECGERFQLIRGRSTAYSTREAVEKALGGRKVDVLVIDAEHTEAAAMGDYNMYKDLLSDRCVTAFHDICMTELWPMWNRL